MFHFVLAHLLPLSSLWVFFGEEITEEVVFLLLEEEIFRQRVEETVLGSISRISYFRHFSAVYLHWFRYSWLHGFVSSQNQYYALFNRFYHYELEFFVWVNFRVFIRTNFFNFKIFSKKNPYEERYFNDAFLFSCKLSSIVAHL